MTFRVGLTGDIASGKSTVSSYLAQKGFAIVDADKISREMTRDHSPVLEAIEASFPGVVREGILDRKKLAQLVFSDEKKRARLNEILHPLIRQEIQSQLDISRDVVFLDAPLLFEGGYERQMDVVVYLSLDRESQLQRLMKRDGLCRGEALKRMDAFDVPRDEKMRKSHVIDNSGSQEELLEEVEAFLQKHQLQPPQVLFLEQKSSLGDTFKETSED